MVINPSIEIFLIIAIAIERIPNSKLSSWEESAEDMYNEGWIGVSPFSCWLVHYWGSWGFMGDAYNKTPVMMMCISYL